MKLKYEIFTENSITSNFYVELKHPTAISSIALDKNIIYIFTR